MFSSSAADGRGGTGDPGRLNSFVSCAPPSLLVKEISGSELLSDDRPAPFRGRYFGFARQRRLCRRPQPRDGGAFGVAAEPAVVSRRRGRGRQDRDRQGAGERIASPAHSPAML